uniref:NYN domain-containing protein n=1 Tax=Chromera velia CCMP2878 TaxID=1169474 RepID=A0A0G4GTU1_9ALVE|eukprot:Cvel_23318.t1-p1 / transcript=Cvel_23318.t1 / gene=Cvel_23318 / organism=Chromera_velia_CCMP2878 / gene_product=hypothetical protein / transcript_product=hypothetical protein / location=Cvel_scaffold2388:17534-21673(+) / protein_length=539 / sequence_SO=supercontig / SO=protein_coding / is_pseudo=false
MRHRLSLLIRLAFFCCLCASCGPWGALAFHVHPSQDSDTIRRREGRHGGEGVVVRLAKRGGSNPSKTAVSFTEEEKSTKQPIEPSERRSPQAPFRWAMLIDADNVLPSHIPGIFLHAQQFGTIYYGIVAGNSYSLRHRNIFQTLCKEHNFVEHKLKSNIKQSAISVLAMDAMALVEDPRSAGVDGFILVSSDTECRGLLIELQAKCKSVIGYGYAKQATTKDVEVLCDGFVRIEQEIPQRFLDVGATLLGTKEPLPPKTRGMWVKDGRALARQFKGLGDAAADLSPWVDAKWDLLFLLGLHEGARGRWAAPSTGSLLESDGGDGDGETDGDADAETESLSSSSTLSQEKGKHSSQGVEQGRKEEGQETGDTEEQEREEGEQDEQRDGDDEDGVLEKEGEKDEEKEKKEEIKDEPGEDEEEPLAEQKDALLASASANADTPKSKRKRKSKRKKKKVVMIGEETVERQVDGVGEEKEGSSPLSEDLTNELANETSDEGDGKQKSTNREKESGSKRKRRRKKWKSTTPATSAMNPDQAPQVT